MPLETKFLDPISVHKTSDKLRITRSHRGWLIYLMTAFILVLDARAFPGLGTDPPSLFIAAILGVFNYIVLMGWFNRTCIDVDHVNIRIRERPFPWFGRNKDFGVSAVKQLWVFKDDDEGVDYEIHALTASGQSTKLIDDFQSREQARFVELEMEKFLNIADFRVDGECSAND